VNAPLVVEICRRLDGLPLAIEFAAPRVEVLGVEGLAARLDDSLLLLQGRRRTAMPRHRTMRAVIDWSYGLLSEDEQRFFRALGLFSGGFTVEAAAAVAMDVARTQVDAIDRLADLVAKSLVVADVGGAKPRFRLLDTTRGYAIEKLDESGERDRIALRHAAYYRDLFERAEGEVTARSTREWLADYAQEIDNLRAALDWAFSPGCEIPIGVALTAAAVPLWMRLSLLKECYSRAKQALGALGTGGPRAEMRLHAALGACLLIYASGGGGVSPEIGPALTRALEIAESLDDAEYQLRSIWGLWALHIETCQFRVALEIAQRFCTLAAKQREGNDQLIGDRFIGVTLHLLGDQARARRYIEHILAHYVPPVEKPHVIRFGIDQRVAARVWLARVLWLQGFPDEAMRTARSAVEEARETNHALSLTLALALGACPIMLWVEDLATAERYITTLLDHSTRHALPFWCSMGRFFQGILVIRRGELGPGLRLLRAGFDQLGGSGWISVMLLSELAASFGRAGQTTEGLAAAEQAIEQAEQTEGRWALPELLRIKGELLLLQAADGAAAAADDHFRQAVDWARRQGELSWELRAATSLARLLRNQGRLADAIACLQPIYDRFKEGFDTADLIVAKRLLDELGSAERE
jgi:predicted ATPase